MTALSGGCGLNLSAKLAQRFHQTTVSRTLRDSFLAPAAKAWWRRYQTQQFHKALGDLALPDQGIPPGIYRHLLDHRDFGAEETDFTQDGDRFYEAMASVCTTSKFHDLGYQDVYGTLLWGRKDTSGVLLEIGIGHNDPDAPSGMEESHVPGASLVGWARFLPNMEIHGADVRHEVLIDTQDYRTHFVDQRDVATLQALAQTFSTGIDIVIDDGLHTPEANANVAATFLPVIRQGGMIIIEDILPEFNYLWESLPRRMVNHISFRFFSGKSLRGERSEGMAVFIRD